MGRYKNIVFDLDGTIADTLGDLAESTNAALVHFGYAPHPIKKYRYFVGNGARLLIKRAMPADATKEQLESALQFFIQYYGENYLVKTKSYDGLPAVLETLHNTGMAFAVVTNKPDYRASTIVTALYGELFEVVAGHTDDYPLKPDPTLTLDVMKRLGAKPENTVFIGDSGVDMMTAKNAGLDSIGVLWGFREENELKENGARFIARTPEDLLKIIL